MARLKERYDEEIVPALTKRFKYTNKMQVPKLEKIVVNMGVGKALEDIKIHCETIAKFYIEGNKELVENKQEEVIDGFIEEENGRLKKTGIPARR